MPERDTAEMSLGYITYSICCKYLLRTGERVIDVTAFSWTQQSMCLPPHWMMETNPDSKMLCFLVCRIMGSGTLVLYTIIRAV